VNRRTLKGAADAAAYFTDLWREYADQHK